MTIKIQFICLALLSWTAAILLDTHLKELKGVLTSANICVEILVGSAPNFVAALFVPIPFMVCRTSFGSNLFYLTIGLMIYEFLQLNIDERTFDPFDLLFSVLGALLCYGLYLFVRVLITFIKQTLSSALS